MRTLWLYIIVLIIICALGLTVGSLNDSVVTFDFLVFKAQLSLAMVMVTGVVIGILIGLYLALLFCLKVWAKSLSVKAELRRLKKENGLDKDGVSESQL